MEGLAIVGRSPQILVSPIDSGHSVPAKIGKILGRRDSNRCWNMREIYLTNPFWNIVSVNFKILGGISLKTTFVRSYIWWCAIRRQFYYDLEGWVVVSWNFFLLQFIQAEKSLTADTWKRYPLQFSVCILLCCGFCSNRILPYFPISVSPSQAWHLKFSQ